jgi:hypothetical protein
MSTDAQLTNSTGTLIVQIHPTDRTPFTSQTCLRFIEEHARTQLIVNFTMIAAGVLYFYTAAFLVTEKSDRMTKAEVKAALARAFGETAAPNSHISRSKQHEFAKLCCDISAHRECRPLVIRAAKLNSFEAAVEFLTREFTERAKSVAALARHFGTERTSGGHPKAGQRIGKVPAEQEQGPTKRPFLLLLGELVDRAEKDGQQIPLVASVNVLVPAVAQRDVLELLVQLIPKATDDALPELINLIERRAARTRPHPA